jgi:hypothetical protein
MPSSIAPSGSSDLEGNGGLREAVVLEAMSISEVVDRIGNRRGWHRATRAPAVAGVTGTQAG